MPLPPFLDHIWYVLWGSSINAERTVRICASTSCRFVAPRNVAIVTSSADRGGPNARSVHGMAERRSGDVWAGHVSGASRPVAVVGMLPQRRRLDQLLTDIRAGRSRTLVMRGPGGAGKTLLSHLTAAAVGLQVLQAGGVPFEVDMLFSGLHQLVMPVLGAVAGLPAAHRHAVESAFGGDDPSPDRFQVGLATLRLLSAEASDGGLLCLVDDAQRVDPASVETLAFVARRLNREGIGLVFAERPAAAGGVTALRGLPDMLVEPLDDGASRELLGSLRGRSPRRPRRGPDPARRAPAIRLRCASSGAA